MNSFAAELKRAREERRMSLADIANSTLINIKFLEEIERGNVSFMPRTYVRAFVRDYAKAVGLNPGDIMNMMDDPSVAGTKSTPRKEPPSPPPPVPLPESAPVPVTVAQEPKDGTPKSNTTRVVTLAIVVLAVAVALWNILSPPGETPVEEKPFEEVIREQLRADSVSKPKEPPAVTPDTLILMAVAKDTVSLRIAIDGARSTRYTLMPRGRRSWKATERFLITLGDAGAAEFSLNQKKLMLGKPGAVLNNVEINRSSLENKQP